MFVFQVIDDEVLNTIGMGARGLDHKKFSRYLADRFKGLGNELIVWLGREYEENMKKEDDPVVSLLGNYWVMVSLMKIGNRSSLCLGYSNVV